MTGCHTASDFVAATANPYDLGYECQRLAATLALQHRYEEAIREYLVSITYFRKADSPNVADRIAFAEGEIARLEALTGGVR